MVERKETCSVWKYRQVAHGRGEIVVIVARNEQTFVGQDPESRLPGGGCQRRFPRSRRTSDDDCSAPADDRCGMKNCEASTRQNDRSGSFDQRACCKCRGFRDQCLSYYAINCGLQQADSYF